VLGVNIFFGPHFLGGKFLLVDQIILGFNISCGATFYCGQKCWGVKKIWDSTFVDPPPRHVRRKLFACVDGGLRGGSIMRRPGSKTPIGTSGNL
jgi:hypothetical protein